MSWVFFYITVWICVAWRHWSYVTCHKRLFIHRTSDVIPVHYESYSYSNKWSQVWINVRDIQEDFIFFFTTFFSLTRKILCYSWIEDKNCKKQWCSLFTFWPPPPTHTHILPWWGGWWKAACRTVCRGSAAGGSMLCTFLFSWN